jgi:hypothetical protein
VVIAAMPLASHPLNVALLAVPEVTASTLFGMVEFMTCAENSLMTRSARDRLEAFRSREG